jgi:hypothetical protein
MVDLVQLDSNFIPRDPSWSHYGQFSHTGTHFCPPCVAIWRFSKPNLGELEFLKVIWHFYFSSGVFLVLIGFWRFFWRF